jgi:hypothetical protein
MLSFSFREYVTLESRVAQIKKKKSRRHFKILGA